MGKVSHLAQASKQSCDALKTWLLQNPEVDRAVLIEDVVGTLSVAIWGKYEKSPAVALSLPEVGGRFWSGRIFTITEPSENIGVEPLLGLGKELMQTAQPVSEANHKLWIAHRFRSRGGWFSIPQHSIWNIRNGPSVVVFYSYKGGVGRSTALASVAIQLARDGQRVALVDADLDAPGIAASFLPEGAALPEVGVVDYLLDSMTEANLDPTPYSWTCRRPELTGDGEIVVIPAGKLDPNYPARLSRLSFDPEPGTAQEHFSTLLKRVKDVFNPTWILVDARTGFTDMAAMTLTGIGHLHIVFGRGSKQTWQGLNIVFDHMGRQRLQFGLPQSECLLVHTMVPREEVGNQLHELFKEAAWECFSDHYYADDEDAKKSGLYDFAWTINDADQDGRAPHQSIRVQYYSGLADFSDLVQVSDRLVQEPGLIALTTRIREWSKEQLISSEGDIP